MVGARCGGKRTYWICSVVIPNCTQRLGIRQDLSSCAGLQMVRNDPVKGARREVDGDTRASGAGEAGGEFALDHGKLWGEAGIEHVAARMRCRYVSK